MKAAPTAFPFLRESPLGKRIARALLGLAVGALAYALLRGPYQAAITWCAALALSVWDPELSLVLVEERQIQAGYFAARTLTIGREELDSLLVGAVLLAALWAARAPAGGAAALARAAALLFAIQALAVASAGLGAQAQTHSPALGSLLGQGAAAATVLVPIALWARGLLRAPPEPMDAPGEVKPAPRAIPKPSGLGAR